MSELIKFEIEVEKSELARLREALATLLGHEGWVRTIRPSSLEESILECEDTERIGAEYQAARKLIRKDEDWDVVLTHVGAFAWARHKDGVVRIGVEGDRKNVVELFGLFAKQIADASSMIIRDYTWEADETDCAPWNLPKWCTNNRDFGEKWRRIFE